MDGFFRSGHAIDLVLLFLSAEALLLGIRLRGSPRRAPVLLALLPGACLFFALRAALTGAAWQWVMLWIVLSLPAHLADLADRIRRRD